jgi:uncharacterized protein (TIGR02996 family)
VTNEEAFLKAAIADPDDPGPRLVYADWLEDRGDPHAGAVRDHPELFRLLASLRTATQTPFDWVEGHAAGHVGLLAALACLLGRCRGVLGELKTPGLPEWTLRHLEEVLALTPDPESVEALLAALADGRGEHADWRKSASLLAGGQTREVLLAALERHAEERTSLELWACLVQEMVVRGADLAGPGAAERLWQALRVRGHPLAVLPLRLTDLEHGLAGYLPSYSYRGSSSSLASPVTGEGTPLPPGGGSPPAVAEVAGVGLAGRLTAFGHPEPNAQVEARVFRAARPLEEGEVSVALLRSLGLECLAGAEGAGTRAEVVPASTALSTLFSAACGGGAYTGGLLGPTAGWRRGSRRRPLLGQRTGRRSRRWPNWSGVASGSPSPPTRSGSTASRGTWACWRSGRTGCRWPCSRRPTRTDAVSPCPTDAVAMTHDDAFLQAIIELPDDTPRVVYADWLEDHRQPDWAAFVRVQCELARLPDALRADSRREELEARERELLARRESQWLGPLHSPSCTGGTLVIGDGGEDVAKGQRAQGGPPGRGNSPPHLLKASHLANIELADIERRTALTRHGTRRSLRLAARGAMGYTLGPVTG